MVVHYKMLTAQTGQALLRPVINTSSWNPGLYIVQVTLDNKTYSTKITVK